MDKRIARSFKALDPASLACGYHWRGFDAIACSICRVGVLQRPEEGKTLFSPCTTESRFFETPDICTDSASNLHSISRTFNVQESRKTPFLATSTPNSCKVF